MNDRSILDPDVAAALREYFRPIPPPSVVAVGRLTAEERDELMGLRRAVKRVRGDLGTAEERAIRNARAADFWLAISAVLFFAVVYLAVGK